MTQKLDPITIEVVRNKLEGIANEMQMTLFHSSFSPIVREGLDASASLFTIEGETLAQAVAIPIHLATLIPVVKRIIQEFPPESMKDGDVYMMNDPYLGGTHLPDIGIVMPVFCQGELVAFSGSMTHHQDIGGMTAGSVPTNATEIFQEGLRLPPLRLRSEQTMNDSIVKIMRLNSRIPDVFLGDIHAQISACTIGVQRLKDLSEKFSASQLRSMFNDLLDRSEKMTRAALLSLPEGTYHYTDYNDNDGIELDKRIKIQVAVTIKDGQLHCDFTGSSPQVKGPFNVVQSGSMAAAYFASRVITGADIPTNGGCFRSISLHLPEGSIVNPVSPAPVNARTATIKRVTSAILGALRQAVPETIGADAAGEMLLLSFGGRSANGDAFVVGELIAGGSGAGHEHDGVDVIETDATNCMNLPIEALESDAPIRVLQSALRIDSGGPGKYRGGLGIVREYEILQDDVSFTHRGERHYSSASGANGGLSGAMARTIIKRVTGVEEVVPSKLVTTLFKGDRILIETAGGGGYGAPHLRSATQVSEDVANGKISQTAATSHYSAQ